MPSTPRVDAPRSHRSDAMRLREYYETTWESTPSDSHRLAALLSQRKARFDALDRGARGPQPRAYVALLRWIFDNVDRAMALVPMSHLPIALRTLYTRGAGRGATTQRRAAACVGAALVVSDGRVCDSSWNRRRLLRAQAHLTHESHREDAIPQDGEPVLDHLYLIILVRYLIMCAPCLDAAVDGVCQSIDAQRSVHQALVMYTAIYARLEDRLAPVCLAVPRDAWTTMLAILEHQRFQVPAGDVVSDDANDRILVPQLFDATACLSNLLRLCGRKAGRYVRTVTQTMLRLHHPVVRRNFEQRLLTELKRSSCPAADACLVFACRICVLTSKPWMVNRWIQLLARVAKGTSPSDSCDEDAACAQALYGYLPDFHQRRMWDLATGALDAALLHVCETTGAADAWQAYARGSAHVTLRDGLLPQTIRALATSVKRHYVKRCDQAVASWSMDRVLAQWPTACTRVQWDAIERQAEQHEGEGGGEAPGGEAPRPRCPITQSPIVIPGLVGQHLFELQPLLRWLVNHETQPLTRAPLDSSQVEVRWS